MPDYTHILKEEHPLISVRLDKMSLGWYKFTNYCVPEENL